MIVAFSGSRNWTDKDFIHSVISERKREIGEVLVGDARGVDAIVREVCAELGIPCRVFYAAWDEIGKFAGVQRNAEILDEHPDLLIAVHEDISKSKGTRNMIKQAQERNIEVKLFIGENRK